MDTLSSAEEMKTSLDYINLDTIILFYHFTD